MTSELIERLEKATGPDRELDALIWYAVVERPAAGEKIDRDMVNRWPTYTASIDAALTLVPEGMRRRTVVMEDGKSGVQLWWPDEDMPGAWGRAHASEPIATVIAALRAKDTGDE